MQYPKIDLVRNYFHVLRKLTEELAIKRTMSSSQLAKSDAVKKIQELAVNRYDHTMIKKWKK